jgi:hypothetical protein
VCDGLYFGKLVVQFLCLMLLERKEEFESRSRMRECDVVLMYSGANCSQQGGAKRALESWIKRTSGSSTPVKMDLLGLESTEVYRKGVARFP